MALFSKGSAENRLTDIQRDKLPIRAVDVHKTKRVSTTHWLEKKNKKHWKSKTSKIFVIAFENGRRGKGVHVGRGWGRLNCRAHACDCTLSAPHVLLLVFCLFAPATFILRPVHFSFYFFFFFCASLFFVFVLGMAIEWWNFVKCSLSARLRREMRQSRLNDSKTQQQ